MREIGGYIELDSYRLPMLHEGAIALNSGRNCLRYLIRAKKIKKIVLPKFLCASISEVCNIEKVSIRFYSVGEDLLPQRIELQDDEWLYIVNYYGQLKNVKLQHFVTTYERVIVDQVQAYFQTPLEGIDTIYTCRKFFGVPDGAFLYSREKIEYDLPQDESYKRMLFLLGRYERTASEFYDVFMTNEKMFEDMPLKSMSKLTSNLLHGIDYNTVKKCRTDNFKVLYNEFQGINKLQLIIPEGAFMYPLYVENGAEIRRRVLKENIYIPMLWPDVLKNCKENELEYDMAKNILPLPVDQRYGLGEMMQIINGIRKYID